MSLSLSLLNGVAVSLFGSILSASFCNVLTTRRTRRIFWCCIAVLLLLQGQIYSVCEAELLRRIYPLTIHLPLILVLCVLTRTVLWPTISVLSAYLCCQLRRWLALFAVALASGGPVLQGAVELAVTLPLLLILLRFITPAIQRLADYSPREQLQFGVIPALYYGFDYLTVVYTDLLTSGAPVAVEFMPFVCCTAYLVFLLYHSAEEQKQLHLREIQKSLDIQLRQSVREINTLRESQNLARQYRHDLRHHLQYVSACIENGQEQQAQTYISGICQEIEAQKVRCYCENEAVNLILSAFDARANRNNIALHVQGALPASIAVSDSDLCVVLSNALENALHACQPIAAEGRACTIDVQFYERIGKFFLQIKNPCENETRFENGIPVSDQLGHGIGVQSICAVVQRYDGACTFFAENGQFVLRLSL